MRRTAVLLAVALFCSGVAASVAGSYPALEVSIAFGVASSDEPTGGDWVDVSSDIAYLSTVTGRDEDPNFSQPAAGQLDLALDNSSGAYDPDNTTGPYYGDLLPLTWVRVRGGGASVSDDVFYGQVSIEGFRVAASPFPGLVTVEVLDMTEQLANTETPESVYAIEVEADAPVAWYRLGESSGTVALDSSGNELHGTYEGGSTFNSRTGLVAGSADNAIAFMAEEQRVVFPTHHVDAYPFSVEAWVELAADDIPATRGLIWKQTGAIGLGVSESQVLSINGLDMGADAGKVRFGVTNLSGTQRGVESSSSVADGNPHHIVFVASDSATFSLYIDGTDDTNAVGVTGNPTMAGYRATIGNQDDRFGTGTPNATLDEVAVYDTALSAARVAAHYEAGTAPWEGELTGARVTHLLDAIDFPASLRTVATGASTLQSVDLGTDAWSALLDVAKAERGEVYIDHADGGKVRFRGRQDRWMETRSLTSQATFGDGGGSEVPYAELDIQDDRIINRATVQRANGSPVTASDAASEAQYQRRTFSDTGLLYETDAESEQRANLIVAEKKDRHRRVRSMVLEPLADTDLAWAQVFAREIGDRITVKYRPPYGGTFSYECWIEGIRHSFDARAQVLRTTFGLSPVPYGATAEPYFIVGTSLISGPARIGY